MFSQNENADVCTTKRKRRATRTRTSYHADLIEQPTYRRMMQQGGRASM
jgi:hypothetical protein